MMKKFAEDYLNLLKGEFSGINLTRISTEEEFYNKQIIDSVCHLKKVNYF